MAPEVSSTGDVGLTAGAFAVDAFVPVIPGSSESPGNSLSALGEFVYGGGIGDLYSGLTSGLGVPAFVPIPAGANPATTTPTAYNPEIDPGLVTVDAKGNVTVIKWQTIRAGLEYTFPRVDGRLRLSGNYANVSSPNAPQLLTVTPATATAAATSNASKIRNALNWVDANLIGDLTPAVRLGVEYAWSRDKYVDTQSGVNHRVQASAFYVF